MAVAMTEIKELRLNIEEFSFGDFVVPNSETLEAMRELRAGEGVRYKDTFEMFSDLGISVANERG